MDSLGSRNLTDPDTGKSIDYDASSMHTHAHTTRIPMNKIRTINTHKRSGKPRSKQREQREQARPKAPRVRYAYDHERNIMVRTGLYDDEYRPVERREKRGGDLWRRFREARIWGVVAGWVLW